MPQPPGFSWIEKPLLAAMARPEGPEDLEWLRRQEIELLMSLTEDPPRRDWVNSAGLLLVHEPMTDMEAPPQEQLDRWRGGELIQRVMPHLTPEEREFLISGSSSEEWDEMWEEE